MKAQFNIRFWLEVAFALVTLFLAVTTIAWARWLEIVFGVDPDHGNGSFERLVVGVAATLCLASLLLARRQWRRGGSEVAAVSPSA
ncbi:MAG: ABC transporter permease [Candidatus Dormibacteria bacterium]